MNKHAELEAHRPSSLVKLISNLLKVIDGQPVGSDARKELVRQGEAFLNRLDHKMDLDELLEHWAVHAPGMWENDQGPEDWYAVSNGDDSIIAYFANETDAFSFRLHKINQALNG